jgi:hypothetical protein
MVSSQNGWKANDRSVITSISVPGGNLAVHNGGVAVIFQHLATRFHNEVEPLVWPGNWGYAERVVRGGSDLSNHASGTAIDLNAPQHPLGTNPANNYSGAQIAAIHNLVNFYEGIIRWGGDYVGRKDGMHFEINDGVSVDRVNQIAAKCGTVVANPAPAPAPSGGGGGGTKYREIGIGDVSELYTSGEQCRKDQADLTDTGFPVTVDGFFGPGSVAAAKTFQRAAGLTQDGAFGPNSRAAIHKVPSYGNGPTARQYQQRLRDRGWHITVDGVWGPKSASILKQFQAEKGIGADGLRGPVTWTSLWTSSN